LDELYPKNGGKSTFLIIIVVLKQQEVIFWLNTCMNKIDSTELLNWFSAIRNLPDHTQRTRMLDSLWSGQLNSKLWVVQQLEEILMGPTNVYIFGGWTGILSNLLFQSKALNIKKIRSIDLDPWCEKVADDVNLIHVIDSWRFKAITGDMSKYDYEWGMFPDLVINTSTEHVSQDIYEEWYSKIPKGTTIVAQGNDFFSCDEHIRCTQSLDEFMHINLVKEEIFAGSLETDMYTRFMCIWRKT
jgi:hypothetical protein